MDSETELIGRVAAIGCGARVSRSRIVGPAIISAGTTVDRSYTVHVRRQGLRDRADDLASIEVPVLVIGAEVAGYRDQNLLSCDLRRSWCT